MKAKLFISVITILIFTKLSFGADVTWDGGGADDNWATANNWSGNVVPGTGDRVIFDGSVSNKNCIITSGTKTVEGVWIKSNYTGTFSHSTTAVTTFVINSQGFVQDGGTYVGQSGTNTGNFTLSGTFTQSGGTHTMNSNTTIIADGINKSGGTLNHTAGTLRLNGITANSGIFTVSVNGTQAFNNLQFYTSTTLDCYVTIQSGNTLVVNGTLTLTNTSGKVLKIDGGDIHAKGQVAVTGSGSMNGGGTTTITFNGTANQLLSSSASALSSPLQKIKIYKTSGNFTLNGSQIFTSKTTFQLDSLGGTFVQNLSTFYFTGKDGQLIDNAKTKDFIFYNLGVNSATSSDTTILTLDNNDIVYSTGNIFIAGAAPSYINGGNISFQGVTSTLGVKVTNTNAIGGGDATIDINSSSSGAMSVLQGNAAGTGALPNISVNKNGGQFRVQYIVNIEGNLSFNGTTGYSSYACNTDGTNVGIIKLKGNLNIPAGSKINAGTATVNISGNGNQTITGNSTAGDGKLCILKIDKASGTLSLQNQIHIGAAFEYVTGTISPGTSTVNVYNTGTFDPQVTVGGAQMNFNNLAFYGNRTVDGDMTVNGDLTIQTGITLTNTASKIKMGGNFVYATTTANYTNSGTSSLEFINTTAKQISASASRSILNLILNGSGGISFTNTVQISGSLTLTKGVISTTTTGILSVLDNATIAGGNFQSYVAGPMKKVGNDACTFPLGGNNNYSPISITAPSSATDEFQAQYYASAQTLGNQIADSLNNISNCGYWKLDRNIGSSTVKVKLGWDSSSCFKPTPYYDAAIARWNSGTSKWDDVTPATITGNQSSGSIETTNNQSTFGYFVLAKKNRPVSYATLNRKLDGGYHLVTNNNLLFQHLEEYQSTSGVLNFKIYQYPSHTTVGGLPSLNVIRGLNYYSLDISALTSGDYYILEVTNEKGEVFLMRFKKN